MVQTEVRESGMAGRREEKDLEMSSDYLYEIIIRNYLYGKSNPDVLLCFMFYNSRKFLIFLILELVRTNGVGTIVGRYRSKQVRRTYSNTEQYTCEQI